MTDAATIFVDDVHGPRAEVAGAAIERADAHSEPALEAPDTVALQHVWLAAQRRPWASLALIPIGVEAPAKRLAAALAAIGEPYLGAAVVVHDATAVSLATLQAELGAMTARAGRAGRAIVALPPLLGCPAGLALARAADAVIVCVALGSSAIAEAEQILDEVGRERVLGSVVFTQKEKR